MFGRASALGSWRQEGNKEKGGISWGSLQSNRMHGTVFLYFHIS
jgi:hypothetical protein